MTRPALPVALAVFIGGALGGLARYAFQDAFPLGLGAFPWTTLAINGSGAFALAVLIVRLGPASRLARPLLGTGFLGGWTTFSAVVVVADQQLAHGHAVLAVGYLLATAAGGVLCALAGFLVAGQRTC